MFTMLSIFKYYYIHQGLDTCQVKNLRPQTELCLLRKMQTQNKSQATCYVGDPQSNPPMFTLKVKAAAFLDGRQDGKGIGLTPPPALSPPTDTTRVVAVSC